MRLYHVVGRKTPTSDSDATPIFRMKIFAPNKVVARSRFWYFLNKMKKIKKTGGEILSVSEVGNISLRWACSSVLAIVTCLRARLR